ncbi:hypothetical protein BN1723_020526, partial [Verticillium longisporum]
HGARRLHRPAGRVAGQGVQGGGRLWRHHHHQDGRPRPRRRCHLGRRRDAHAHRLHRHGRAHARL